MGFTKVGDWGKVRGVCAVLGREMAKARELSLMRVGLKAEGVAKEHISRQDLGWTELKPATIAFKIRHGFSENILVQTSTYFQSITSWVNGDTAYAGVTKQVKEKDGTLVADIAKVHEYGSHSGKIPSRPLWQPTYEEVLRWHISKNNPAEIFMERINKYL